MKGLAYVLACAGLVAAALSGCNKTTNNTVTEPVSTASPLIGKWSVISGPIRAKYLIFKSDNTYDFLLLHTDSLRELQNGVYQTSGNTVDLGESQSPSIYAFTIASDTMTMYTPSVVVKCYLNPSAPSDTQWQKTVVVLDSIIAPIPSVTGLAVIGNTLWYGNAYDSYYFYKINLTSRKLDSLTSPVYAWGLGWDGKNLWASSDGESTIYKIDTATGNVLFTSKAMGPWIYGIAWDGSSMWVSSGNNESIYRYSPGTDAILNTYPLDEQPKGLGFAGGFLYVVSNGTINKCTTAPFAAVASYTLPNGDPFGISFDGTYFWVSAQVGNTAMIYKVSLP